jgi:hypothetical protein
MLNLQASRPFVYRQLIPQFSKMIAAKIPEHYRKQMILQWQIYRPISGIYARAMDADSGPFAIEYHITYLLCLGFWFFALVLLARICMDTTGDAFASLAGPLIFALIYPVLMTRGGFFYDPVEIFFLAASLLLATRGRLVALFLLTPVATLNKESFLFWLPCLWCLLPDSFSALKRTVGLGMAVMASGVTYLVLRAGFLSNAGGAVEFHLLENLHFYSTPSSYFRREFTYGYALPAGVSVVNLAVLGAIICLGWPELPMRWKRHAGIALCINIPLFVTLCWLDELRNLSLLFVALTVLIASALHRCAMLPVMAPDPPRLG